MSPTPVLLRARKSLSCCARSRKAIYAVVERAQLPSIMGMGERMLVGGDAYCSTSSTRSSTPSLEKSTAMNLTVRPYRQGRIDGRRGRADSRTAPGAGEHRRLTDPLQVRRTTMGPGPGAALAPARPPSTREGRCPHLNNSRRGSSMVTRERTGRSRAESLRRK